MRKLSVTLGALALVVPSAPVLAQADPEFDQLLCAELTPYAESVAADIAAAGGRMTVDNITELASFEVLCDDKIMRTTHVVSVNPGDLDVGWEVIKQDEWDGIYCDGNVWEQAIDGGWQVIHVIRFVNKTQHVIIATCD